MVTKRLVDIDDELLAAAREALGATSMKETVNRALKETVDLAARRSFLLRLEEDGLPDLRDPAVRASAWR